MYIVVTKNTRYEDFELGAYYLKNGNVFNGGLKQSDFKYLNVYKNQNCFIRVGETMTFNLTNRIEYIQYLFLTKHKYFLKFFEIKKYYEVN